MWKTYRDIIRKYPRISLQEERRLIREAKRGGKAQAQELVLRHIGFVIFRIHKRAFPAYARRFGEDILSQAIVVLYERVQAYNLRYYDKQGNFKPVRFVSYIWKFVDGLILASLRKELLHEKQRVTACRDGEEYDIFERLPAGNGPIIPALL
jgi:DNA-directed RNA polymerase specialized sigma subunit